MKHPVPLRELVGFTRVAASSSSPGKVSFDIGPNQLALVDELGNSVLRQGLHMIDVTDGVHSTSSFFVHVDEERLLNKVPPMPGTQGQHSSEATEALYV